MSSGGSIGPIPKGVAAGEGIAIILGFIPFLGFLGPFIGAAVATYIEEYGILYSVASGLAIGVASLAPVAFFFILGAFLVGGGSLLGADALGELGALSSIFSSFYGIFALFLNPIAGVLGGLALGIYFHLIYKATDATQANQRQFQ